MKDFTLIFPITYLTFQFMLVLPPECSNLKEKYIYAKEYLRSDVNTILLQTTSSALVKYQSLFEDVVRDISALTRKGDYLTARLNDLKEFLRQLDELNESNERRFTETLERVLGNIAAFTHADLTNLPDDERIFGEILRSNGLVEVMQERADEFEKMRRLVIHEVQYYMQTLPYEERGLAFPVAHWLYIYEHEQDPMKRHEIFNSFFTFLN